MQQIKSSQASRSHSAGWRIYAISGPAASHSQEPASQGVDWTRLCLDLRKREFDSIWIPAEALAEPAIRQHCIKACAQAELRLVLDLLPGDDLYRDAVGGLKEFANQAQSEGAKLALLLRGLGSMDSKAGHDAIAVLRQDEIEILVWTPGMSSAQVAALEGLGLAGVFSSLPWWDFREGWLVDEYQRLNAVARVIAPLADPRAGAQHPATVNQIALRLAAASVVGQGVLVPGTYVDLLGPEKLEECLRHAIPSAGSGAGLLRLTGALSPITALFRSDDGGRLLLLNPASSRAASIPRSLVERRLPNGFVLEPKSEGKAQQFEVGPEEWTLLPLKYADWIAKYGTTSRQLRSSLTAAMRSPRIAIESVQPVIDGGRFAVKRSLGETVVVRANIFMDGHEELAAELLWRAANETDWQKIPMRALGNDAWEASIFPRKLGHYLFTVRAWVNTWHSFRVQLQKKHAAGVDVSLEVEEARRMLKTWLHKAKSRDEQAAAMLDKTLSVIGQPLDEAPVRKLRPRPGGTRVPPAESAGSVAIPPAHPQQVEALLTDALGQAIASVAEPDFETQTDQEFPISMERSEAMFSSWYELFPRSQGADAETHGTLRDVIERLPDIQAMGFDVLYFPPIHPIGERNRKGRNNSLQARPGDPGSPYAIGSEQGGHDAIHPELGTLQDFRDLLVAAKQHELEVALDFAIQCSPDHPWLREHPDWFNWRVDGSLKHAENPPKRYEDIVNPDFYSPLASSTRQAALWRALRDVVMFWVQQGVRIFRVDNPHTKPLPFWEWLLREVRDRHPDTIFLSEAFTRPAMMYRLAKLGFSQSYTYFTWRNTKQELTEYLTELNREPVRDFFRPNFFVNTPDINPWFLQTSGRPGFLIRAVLAGTLSGSWGMYNGFELCVADAVPGKEEYLDSEKYQLRQWDMNAPGNIIEEITRLNWIRRSHPALQSHLGVDFHRVDNERILFYSRYSAEGDSVVLVAVSLDPHHRQSGMLELPFGAWGLDENASVPLHDLFEDRRFRVRGRWQHIELTPERPFVLWARVLEHGDAA